MSKKKRKHLLVLTLVVALCLCSCGKHGDNAENSAGYEQVDNSSSAEVQGNTAESSNTEMIVGAGSAESTTDMQTTETIKSGAEHTSESEEGAEGTEEETEESAEGKGEPGKEGSTPAKEESNPSKETGSASKESSAPSKENVNPGQETKPSAEPPASGIEQTTPSVAPPVHTCNFASVSVSRAATCTSEGEKTLTCSCGASKTESIPATGHSYVTDAKAATCTEDGYQKTTCSTCGDVKEHTVIPATGHALREVWFPCEPNCISGGDMHFNFCDICKYKEDLPKGEPLGHLADEGTMVWAPTCRDGGLYEHHCVRCGHTMADTVGAPDPNAHEWAWDEEEQLTYCALCGAVK